MSIEHRDRATVAIKIIPVTAGNYYRTIVYDLERDTSGREITFVTDIYHSNSLSLAIELLNRLFMEGAFDQ